MKATGDVWQSIVADAERLARSEPALAARLSAAVLRQENLSGAVIWQIEQRLSDGKLFAAAARDAFSASPAIVDAACRDLEAVLRDPADKSLLSVLLNYKGFVALQAWRVSNWLWFNGRQQLALMIQSAVSENLHISIHPSASIGSSVFLDHGTGIVIGASARIGDGVTMLQNVTIGRMGAADSPRIGAGVYLGAGAAVVGDIVVGDFAKIGAGTVVTHDVPPGCTAVGVPSKHVNCPEAVPA